MEKLITPQELADSLGVSISTIYDWSYQKRIPRVPGMRLLRFRESEIEAWLSAPVTPRLTGVKPPAAPARMNSQRPPKRAGMNSEIDKLVERAKSEVLS